MTRSRRPRGAISPGNAAIAVFLISFAAGPFSTMEAAVPDRERQVKAVFLFNFTRFVMWPDGAFSGKDAPLVIGILGSDPFGDFLDEVVKGEKVDSHPIQTRRFSRVEEIGDCHILFIGEMQGLQPETTLASLGNRPILTVGESEDFASRGGMAGFTRKKGRIRLQFNLEAIESADLKVSAKLLRLADTVSGESG